MKINSTEPLIGRLTKYANICRVNAVGADLVSALDEGKHEVCPYGFIENIKRENENMLKLFYPHEYAQSVFAIDYGKLFAKGYRGIIFDLDNTLVHHGDDSTEEIDGLFRTIHGAGLKTILLSNNTVERIESFLKNIDSLYIDDAQKPRVKNYLRAVEMLSIKKEQAIFIGDQVFTDIFGANRSGIDSILVQYIRTENEIKIGKRRQLERIILKFYRANKSCQNRIGDIYKKEPF